MSLINALKAPSRPDTPSGSDAPEPGEAAEAAEPSRRPRRARTVAGRLTTGLAAGLVWFALVGPNQLIHLTPAAFVRIPIEGLVLLALCLVLPARARTVLAAAVGVLLGLLTVLKILDMGFFDVLDRPFNPVSDWGSFGPALGVVRDSVGSGWTNAAVVGALALAIAVVVFTPLGLVRLTRLLAGRRRVSARALAALGIVWLLCASLGLRIVAGAPIASTSAAGLGYSEIRQVTATIQDRHRFAAELKAADPIRNTPTGNLLTGLRGKDVIVAFVESYGKVAVQGSAFSPQVDAVLNDGTRSLQASGYGSRSAFLTSPTFGGISWLAHSTLQSGLWVDSQQRYDQLVASHRFTLSDAFKRAGWRTVGDVPSDGSSWPQGRSFYHYDTLYNSGNVGYAGPRFSYATMPDQFILSEFQRRELGAPHRPVMAEIDLVSSHTPWAPLPRMVEWSQVGDGSVFDAIHAQGRVRNIGLRSGEEVKAAYGQSIEYSLSALISFVRTFHDKNLVLVMLGDHQPSTVVSGSNASHEVPISIIAHDPKVLDRISSWGWQGGLLPRTGAPVWPMDAFRNRFLTAYGS
jgi:hypothetical protein